MHASVAQNAPQRSGGRFSERPLVVDAEPLNNLVAAVDDVLKKTAQAARAHFQIAAELQRDARRLALVRRDVIASIAARDRKPA